MLQSLWPERHRGQKNAMSVKIEENMKFKQKTKLRLGKLTVTNLNVTAMGGIKAGDSETYGVPCNTSNQTTFKCWTETAGTNSPYCDSFYISDCCY